MPAAPLCSPSTLPEVLPSRDAPAGAQRDEEPRGEFLPAHASFRVGWDGKTENEK